MNTADMAEEVNDHMLKAINQAIVELKLMEDMLSNGEIDIASPDSDKLTSFQVAFGHFVMTDLMNQFNAEHDSSAAYIKPTLCEE